MKESDPDFPGTFEDTHASAAKRWRASINFKPVKGRKGKYQLGSHPSREKAFAQYQFARATGLFPRAFLMERLRKAEDTVMWCIEQLELTDAYLEAIDYAQEPEPQEDGADRYEPLRERIVRSDYE